MTELEYVNLILKKAQAYIREVGKEPGDKMAMKPIAEWEHVKSMLSAHTTVRLCEVWKDQEASTAPQPSEPPQTPDN